MSKTPNRALCGATECIVLNGEEIDPDDIDSEWLDRMVKRLFKELQKQLARIEATKPSDNDPKQASVRAANVRALSTIERTLERLMRAEQQRVAQRKVMTVMQHDQRRADLISRLDKLLEYRRAEELPEEHRE